MQFTDLGLSADILRAVSEQGYDKPTPIQAHAIPVVLGGHDLMAAAQTGTGKTAGFTLPVLQLLSTPSTAAHTKPRVLVLTPTRELAAQVEDSVRTYGKYLPLKSVVIYGGVGMAPQTKALRSGVDIIVATPGRLLDHVGERTVDLSSVEIFILDEADRMLDMGFIHDIRRIVALLPKKKQTLMFSATFSDEIRVLASTYLHNPQQIEVARRNATADMVMQNVYLVDKAKKRDLLVKLIEDNGWHQVLVFTRTKHGANALAEKLGKAGIRSSAIHGNKSQGARTRALADFKSLKLHVLVATDIAARGIDIDLLPHVVNYELPNVPEDYIHRIGRTGRAGSAGQAVSLVCVDEHKLLREIEHLLKREIEVKAVAGFEVDPRIKAQPIESGQRRQLPRGTAPFGQRKPQQSAPQSAKPASSTSGQTPNTERGTGTRRRFS
ncbi:DEAD/DEAH box helicase [Noviherbaspirillum galbum]|uniref:DEAD-box ATP-dependent RNA helicase RhpA n=1 Tax=Noviherbaspirillum galbum TaxID=2709383 RepID=A0A6B3SXC2_9BURK|nr:DEAD/DEAH box helicase [Noviherbaspirillum galbum]NEX63132.1 DEAD/DEAH box helicase [Noviherbaspirillum galbum]